MMKHLGYILLPLFAYLAIQASAQVSATKADSLLYDANGNKLANPGDSLNYKTKVKNTSGGTVDPGAYSANNSANRHHGPCRVGTEVNDLDDNLALASITPQVSQPTSMGGTDTVNVDGSFMYTPPRGVYGQRQLHIYTGGWQ